MTFDNFLWHLETWSFISCGFAYPSEFGEGLEFAAPNCNLYHLLILFFFFSFHMVSALSACTIPLLVPSPSKVKVSHDRICVPGNEWICPLKFHSHMQTHFYQKYFSQLIFPQTKLSKKENHKYFQRTLFWALALQNYHIIKRHLWNRLLFHSFICLFPWNILSTCMLFVI